MCWWMWHHFVYIWIQFWCHLLCYTSVVFRMCSLGFGHRWANFRRYADTFWFVIKLVNVIVLFIFLAIFGRKRFRGHFRCKLQIIKPHLSYKCANTSFNFICIKFTDRLCGLVVRVSGYRYRVLGFDSRRYQIFWVVVGLERGPLSLVRSIEELLE